MAYPTVSASEVSPGLSGTTQSVPLAAHAAGERLVVLYALDGGASNYVSNEGGWTVLANRTETQNAISLLAFEKIAASSSESLSITLSATRTARAISISVQGSDTSAPAEIALAGSDGAPSANPNPLSLTPTYGAADTLWLVALAHDNSTYTLSGYPSGYDTAQLENAGGTSATPRVAIAARSANATTEDPGSFTISTGEQWVAATIAIKPASSGGGSGVSTTISATTAPAVASVTGSAGSAGVSTTISATTSPAQVAITGVAGSASGNIRLSLGMQRERGGSAASLSSLKWCVFNADHTAVIASGTALTTDANGNAVIDVNGTSYAPGDYVPVLVTDYNAATSAQDRVVRTFFGFVPAQAQP